jgi:hypothetical protein
MCFLIGTESISKYCLEEIQSQRFNHLHYSATLKCRTLKLEVVDDIERDLDFFFF